MRLLLAAAVVLLVACDPAADVAGAQTINAQRAAYCGEAPLTLDVTVMVVAQSRADQLAIDGWLHHTANLWDGIPAQFTVTAENVGVGGDVQAVMDGFAASPDHLANICSPSVTDSGYGQTQSPDGRWWVVEVFAG